MAHVQLLRESWFMGHAWNAYLSDCVPFGLRTLRIACPPGSVSLGTEKPDAICFVCTIVVSPEQPRTVDMGTCPL